MNTHEGPNIYTLGKVDPEAVVLLIAERDALKAELAALKAKPVQPAIFECDIKPRALDYPLKDYHTAMASGPLNFTWKDKPHRLVYDLIAAVKFYAAPAQPVQEPVMRVTPTMKGVFPVWFDEDWRQSVYKHGAEYGTGIALYAAPVQEPVAMLHDDGYWTRINTPAGRAFADKRPLPPTKVYAATVAQPALLTDADILALNANEVFFSESPSKYPEAGHGIQYHAGAPGVIAFARAVLNLGTGGAG